MELVANTIEKQQKDSGQSVDIPQDVLLRRAVSIAFGDVRSRVPSDRSKIEKQSRRRRPVGGRVGSGAGASIPSTTGDEDVMAIARSPKIRAFWEKAQRENGDL
jgi:hypothetical protein